VTLRPLCSDLTLVIWPIMEGPNKERWIQLSEQAAVEQDPHKLLELVNELNALLEENELRLAALRKTGSVPTNTPTK
jgi:hypothetical protein